MNIYYLKKFRKEAYQEIKILYNRGRDTFQIVKRLSNIPIYPLQEYECLDEAKIALEKERRRWVEMLLRIQIDKVSPKSIQNKIIAKI